MSTYEVEHMQRDPNDYPRDHKPGTHWATDKAWQIMDLIPPDGISSPLLRDLMSGMIAGALVEARKLGAREGNVPGPKIHDPTIAHMIDVDAQISDIQFIVKAARAFLFPLLAGHEPEVQSAVLADLVATYLAGVAPPLRPELRAMLIELVDQLVPENERELFGDAGHPAKES